MRLKRYRIQNDIPASRVCKELGIGRSTLSRYETGSQFPRPEILVRIKKWSDGQVTPEDFLDQNNGLKVA